MTDATDEFIAAHVEEALAPFRAILDEATLEQMRIEMACALATHPVARQIVSRARPRAVPLSSAEVALDATGEGIGPIALKKRAAD